MCIYIYIKIRNLHSRHNNVVDWYVNQLDKEADEAHYCEANRSCDSYLLEFALIWLCTLLHESDRVLSELTRRLKERFYLVHLYELALASLADRCSKMIQRLSGFAAIKTSTRPVSRVSLCLCHWMCVTVSM